MIVESIVLELGPVLTGLVLAGRIGARYAAELGTMRVTEQIDALESLGRSPASHLILPRVLAGSLMIPALVVLADVMGIVAGWFSMKVVLPITNEDFAYGARSFWRPFDAAYSVIKAFFFAGSITIIACYMGFNTQQGAEGVGRATTGAVVSELGDDPPARRPPRQAVPGLDDRAPRRAQARSAARWSSTASTSTCSEGETRRTAGSLGHGQERAAQAHHRPHPARTPAP